jgi:hypothetical protein
MFEGPSLVLNHYTETRLLWGENGGYDAGLIQSAYVGTCRNLLR